MPPAIPIRPRTRLRRVTGYSLVELLVAAAVLASAAMGIYAVFLRMNEAAADLRFYTSAKQLLQRAATQALTVEWTQELETTGKRPTILTATGSLAGQDYQGFVVCDIDYDANFPVVNYVRNYGVYSIFTSPDPSNTDGNMSCTLYRKVKEAPLGTNNQTASTNAKIDDGKMLVQVSFRLDYTVHGKTKPSMYFYTARARTKN